MKTTKVSTEKKRINLRDGFHQAPWSAEASMEAVAQAHKSDQIYDCLVVGGGITGLSAALRLQNSGKRVVLADAHTCGFGTTGGTSAHINTFADTTFKEAESAFGPEGAQLFADAINDGFALISDTIKQYNIKCDYESRTGYLYAQTDEEVKQLDDICTGAVQNSVPVKYTDQVPTPLSYKSALEFLGQAQFHPLKYLAGIKDAYKKAGGIILENTLIDGMETENNIHVASSGDLRINAWTVIYATHMPPGITSFNFRCAPYRSYVLGVKLKRDVYPDALVYDMQEPYHYFRSHVIEGEKLLIAGGNDHKTGHDEPGKAFENLENYIRKHYPVSSVKYKWSSQYYVPVDGLPYIGQMAEAAKGVYCATGFNGNGMMLGSVSALILSDLVLGKTNRYTEIFNPSRIKPVAGFKEFVKENADAVYHLVADRFSIHETDSLNRLRPDSGKVVEVDGQQVAAYKDENGVLHTLNPVCTHAKCIVNWNAEERSWDCPCHGARYDIDGSVLTGPARKPLQKIK